MEMEEPRKCDVCENLLAEWIVVSNYWRQRPWGDTGWLVRTNTATKRLVVCSDCLMSVLTGLEGYHMVYSIDVASIPDGADFGWLLEAGYKSHCRSYPEEFWVRYPQLRAENQRKILNYIAGLAKEEVSDEQ